MLCSRAIRHGTVDASLDSSVVLPRHLVFLIARVSSVMVHARSLRVIGQALEQAKVTVFELEKHGQYYVAWSDSLPDANTWISRQGLTKDVCGAGARQSKAGSSLCFSSADISRLDSEAYKRRRHHSSAQVQATNNLSQRLRALGDHLDRNSVNAFHVSWTPECVSIVNLPASDLVVERTTLTPEKLQQLSFQKRLRRSGPHVLRLISRRSKLARD